MMKQLFLGAILSLSPLLPATAVQAAERPVAKKQPTATAGTRIDPQMAFFGVRGGWGLGIGRSYGWGGNPYYGYGYSPYSYYGYGYGGGCGSCRCGGCY